jgi:GH15 family glucan-1,4-alpha-glucosidase
MANSNTTKSKSVIISSASRRTSNEIASTSHDSFHITNSNSNGFSVNFSWPNFNINSILSSIQQQTKLFHNYQTTQVRIYERTNPNFLYQLDEIHRILRDRTDIKWTYHQK